MSMTMGLHYVTIAGNLASNPQKTYKDDAGFTVTVNDNTRIDYNCYASGKMGDLVIKKFKQGDAIILGGKIAYIKDNKPYIKVRQLAFPGKGFEVVIRGGQVKNQPRTHTTRKNELIVDFKMDIDFDYKQNKHVQETDVVLMNQLSNFGEKINPGDPLLVMGQTVEHVDNNNNNIKKLFVTDLRWTEKNKRKKVKKTKELSQSNPNVYHLNSNGGNNKAKNENNFSSSIRKDENKAPKEKLKSHPQNKKFIPPDNKDNTMIEDRINLTKEELELFRKESSFLLS